MVPAAFPFFRFAGSHRQIGRQFGESCADLIHRHRDLALARLERGSRLTPSAALSAAIEFRDCVVAHAPFFDQEAQGLAEGARLSLAEVYLLQLRAELAVLATGGHAAEPGDECTTFAALPAATAAGAPLIGQNADLPAFYREVAVVAEFVPDDGPRMLMLTPAGQLSYIGINDRGLGVFANFLTCDGWRVGFPRYLLSRLALCHDTVDAAIAAIRAVPRASSRNLIMIDRHGTAADLETTPTRDARLEPVDGLLAHANHYLAPDLRTAERSATRYLTNSRVRHERMETLLRRHRGQLDAATMEKILRDRNDQPDAICHLPGDNSESDTITFASIIAEPAAGRMRVAVGPPTEHSYQLYAFTDPATAGIGARVAGAGSSRS